MTKHASLFSTTTVNTVHITC